MLRKNLLTKIRTLRIRVLSNETRDHHPVMREAVTIQLKVKSLETEETTANREISNLQDVQEVAKDLAPIALHLKKDKTIEMLILIPTLKFTSLASEEKQEKTTSELSLKNSAQLTQLLLETTLLSSTI